MRTIKIAIITIWLLFGANTTPSAHTDTYYSHADEPVTIHVTRHYGNKVIGL